MTTQQISDTVTVPASTQLVGPWTVVGSGTLPENALYRCGGPSTLTVDGKIVTAAGENVQIVGSGGSATATGRGSTVVQVGNITGKVTIGGPGGFSIG